MIMILLLMTSLCLLQTVFWLIDFILIEIKSVDYFVTSKIVQWSTLFTDIGYAFWCIGYWLLCFKYWQTAFEFDYLFCMRNDDR